MNDSLKNNIIEKVLMIIDCEKWEWLSVLMESMCFGTWTWVASARSVKDAYCPEPKNQVCPVVFKIRSWWFSSILITIMALKLATLTSWASTRRYFAKHSTLCIGVENDFWVSGLRIQHYEIAIVISRGATSRFG